MHDASTRGECPRSCRSPGVHDNGRRVQSSIPESARLRAKIDELFAQVARLGAQLLLQAALEVEVSAFWAGTGTREPRPTPEAVAGCV